jgi:hypothetical protein
MNTNTPITVFRAQFAIIAAGVSALVSISAGAPAFAEDAKDNARSGHIAAEVATGLAQPLDALGGQSLAQYLQEHQEGDTRMFRGL